MEFQGNNSMNSKFLFPLTVITCVHRRLPKHGVPLRDSPTAEAARLHKPSIQTSDCKFRKIGDDQAVPGVGCRSGLELLSSNELGARSEVIVFLAALKWINHEFIEREEHIMSIFDKVRFPLMGKEEILACYHPPILPGIVKIPKIKRKLMNATYNRKMEVIEIILLKKIRGFTFSQKSLGQENLFVELSSEKRTFLFEGEPIVLWDIYMYEPDKFESNRRTQAATKIQSAFRGYITRKNFRERFAVATYAATVIQSKFRGYSVRKNIGSLIGSSVKSDSASNKTKDDVSECLRTPMETSKMYVMGAYNKELKKKGQNTIFKFDVKDRSWTTVTKCPVPRHDARMVATEDAIYVVGK
ncbi:BACK domain-containing protein [Caerostris extrusa]|uniref:BACK domain-containing protein n=1 Tax=Caerostris extrusa TaxID=172846 RepID=A0AAV4R1L8_CAEEX|nr:BACK domain-containing protein [Caerostris extrusa]